MGAVNVSNECVDGTQQATIRATNGIVRVEIDGIETHELTVGPGTHLIVWYGPASHDPTVEVEWNRTVVEVPALDCTPTTTAAPPTTNEATTSTAASTSPPASAPPTTWAASSQHAETTAVVGQTLPATGDGIALPIAGLGLTLAGLALLRVRRRPA